MKTPIFVGSGTAIVTPYRGYEVDYDKMAELIEMQYEGGTSALIICGTTGENPTQTIEEHAKVVDFSVKHTAGRMKTIAGVGSNDTMTALELGKAAEDSGVDGILMVTPYYNKTSQKGLVEHFSYVADRVKVPMILYNVPGRTSIGIAADTYKILSQHPNINGVKEASGDISLFCKTRALCGDDLYIWSGNDDNTIPMMAMGAKGVISVASNIVPDVVTKLCDHCLKGEIDAASQIYYKYAQLFDDLFIEVNPIPVKTAMNLMGLDVGNLRLPLVDMAPGTLAKLTATMQSVGIEIK